MFYKILYYVLITLICSGFVTYIHHCIRFYWGYKNLKTRVSHLKRSISIVVVGRNEAANLHALMTSLVNQTYPAELYEIIYVDDESEDDTQNIIKAFSDIRVPVHYLRNSGREHLISPKKHGMDFAIRAAQGELIVTTDADCVVPLTWLESIVQAFTDDVSMVAGYSRTRLPDWQSSSLLHKYEHFDFAATYMVLGGGYTLGRSWACIGQNLAYKKSAWEEVGGFKEISHIITGDDVNLMQLMRRRGHRIVFNFDPRSFVYTNPIDSWKGLLNQRARWASDMKYQLRYDPEFFFILLSMAFLYWGTPLMLIFNWRLALIFFALRIIIELTFLSYTRSRFQVSGKMMRFYPVWVFIQTFFLVFTMVLGQFNLFVWHGKKPPKGALT